MSSNRPKNLDLSTVAFPITAITSILHRISGVFLFLIIPLILCAWESSLSSAESYKEITRWFDGGVGKIFALLAMVALAYHVIAGVRHLLMDVGIGESLESGRLGSKIVLVLTAISAVFIGVSLW